jgi:hypothetical protein
MDLYALVICPFENILETIMTINDPHQPIEEIGEALANFSLDRQSVLYAMERLPEGPSLNRVAIEYEIQLLRILSVGWAISYFMEDHVSKNPLIKKFWDVMFELSKNISSVTSLSIGKEVDYFRTLKERIDIYLKALAEAPLVKDPASVIGPTFARLCENADNVHVIMAGNRVFHLSLEGVKHCLESFLSAGNNLAAASEVSDMRLEAAERC